MELFPDVVSTDAILDQIAIDLRRKVAPRILEQHKDRQTRAAGQSLKHGNKIDLVLMTRHFVE